MRNSKLTRASRLLVLPPISTAGLTPADVSDLTRTTRDLMLRELHLLSQTPAGQAAQYPPGRRPPVLPSLSAGPKTTTEKAPREALLQTKLHADGAATTSGADAGKVRDAL